MQSPGAGPDITYVAVVDDDGSLCRSLSRLLRTAGFQPVSYPSAEAFLEDAKRPQFDCLVLDIQLGGMSGLELCRRLGAVRDVTPVIFITAHDDPQVRSEAMACGCGGFFHKNDPGTLIVDAIRSAVRSARGKSAKSARPAAKPAPKSHDELRRQ